MAEVRVGFGSVEVRSDGIDLGYIIDTPDGVTGNVVGLYGLNPTRLPFAIEALLKDDTLVRLDVPGGTKTRLRKDFPPGKRPALLRLEAGTLDEKGRVRTRGAWTWPKKRLTVYRDVNLPRSLRL